jgi:hypothetical protein
VEQLTKFDRDRGLSEESLRSLVLVDVKRDIPKIKIQKTVGTHIYVRITSIEVSQFWAACYVSVEMRRPARVLTEKDNAVVGFTLAPVWEKGAVLSRSIDWYGCESPRRNKQQTY